MNPLIPLSAALNSAHIPFVVVGSVASSARGNPRTTNDVDLVVRIHSAQAAHLAAALGPDWYAEPEQIQNALRANRAFNVIHMRSGWKVDLFPAHTEFHESEMGRATMEDVEIEAESILCPVSTAEDTILGKLRWYKDGGQVSQRQWRDIMDVIAVHRANLDLTYMGLWAAWLRVDDLLEKALTDPGVE